MVSFIYQRRRVWPGALLLLCVGLAFMSCTDNPNSVSTSGVGPKEEAEKFLAEAEKRLLDLNIKAGRADWVKSTFITAGTCASSAVYQHRLHSAIFPQPGNLRAFPAERSRLVISCSALWKRPAAHRPRQFESRQHDLDRLRDRLRDRIGARRFYHRLADAKGRGEGAREIHQSETDR